MPTGSEAGKLNKQDLGKTGRTFLLVAVAAGLSWLLDNVAELNLGQWQVIAIAGITSVLDLIRRQMKNNKPV
jgi:hypothetical protein